MSWLAAVTLLLFLGALVDVGVGMRRLRRLDGPPAPPPGRWPSLSVVIPARNEARHLAEALQSVLALDYPALEILVVDDRSTDATPQILEELARRHPTLRVTTVTDLPDGWMGKNHALSVGAGLTEGELLLFTDADVVMAPDAVRRAVAILEADGLDHLAVAPRIVARSFALRCMVATFGLYFTLFMRPWRASTPGARESIGIGAFNLVRRRTYEAIGTHARVRMAPDDDLQLGRAIKGDGHRQALALSGALVSVEWYASVRELVAGLMKNAFAGLDYRVSLVAGSVVALLVINVWPFVALLTASGPTWWLNLAVATAAVTLFVTHTRMHGGRGGEVVMYPLATLLFCWILVRAAWMALGTGGIEWRGRRYPLDRIRAARLR
ncbi:glycosyltransferase [Luteitalea sp. TBR-22]|uniref:glycosyltransferase n=1 Tax=Luteitalea sp. TBR-22 TaxID=2802971 RepID=UPI001EF73412|nr:glycosyltransferase [Luteitalea sp. TBR-22]